MWTWPALTFQLSTYQVQKTGQRGGPWALGWWDGLPGFSALSAPSSELPPPPCVFQLPFSRPPFFYTLMYRHHFFCVSGRGDVRRLAQCYEPFQRKYETEQKSTCLLDLQWVAPDHASLSDFCPCWPHVQYFTGSVSVVCWTGSTQGSWELPSCLGFTELVFEVWEDW